MVQDYKKGRLILLFLLLILTGCNISPGGQVLTGQEKTAVYEEGSLWEETADHTGESAAEQKIWVHVCGEVKNPGVYELERESRVIDAIQAAGGFTKKADEESLNLAEGLSDASKIRVMSRDEQDEKEEENKNKTGKSQDSDGRINLNTATLEELMTLPGIGEKRAQAILNLREQKGSFQKIDDLMEAEGIKEGIFQKIKDLIKV